MSQGPEVPRHPLAAIFAAVLFCGFLSVSLLAARQAPAERFDNQVRADMFAGLAGDATAMDRAMKLCEETLGGMESFRGARAHPKHVPPHRLLGFPRQQ